MGGNRKWCTQKWEHIFFLIEGGEVTESVSEKSCDCSIRIYSKNSRTIVPVKASVQLLSLDQWLKLSDCCIRVHSYLFS